MVFITWLALYTQTGVRAGMRRSLTRLSARGVPSVCLLLANFLWFGHMVLVCCCPETAEAKVEESCCSHPTAAAVAEASARGCECCLDTQEQVDLTAEIPLAKGSLAKALAPSTGRTSGQTLATERWQLPRPRPPDLAHYRMTHRIRC